MLVVFFFFIICYKGGAYFSIVIVVVRAVTSAPLVAETIAVYLCVLETPDNTIYTVFIET